MHVLYGACIVAYAYFVYKAIPTVWLWCRARYMLRHLPRETEEPGTLLGGPQLALGPQRHLLYRGNGKRCHASQYDSRVGVCMLMTLPYLAPAETALLKTLFLTPAEISC